MSYSGRALRDLEAEGWEITETLHSEGSVTDWHEHEVGHFCLVVAGGLVDEGGDAHRDCGPGTLLYFPAGIPHRDRFLESGARCLNLRPPGQRDAGVSPASADAASGILVCEGQASWLASRVYDRLRIETGCPGPSPPELAALLETASARDVPEPEGTPPWLERARALIDEEWADGARLGTIADRVSVSRYHLARSFRERFGCSIGQYVHRLRVTRARHLLLATDASLSRIAFATGFADQSHFTRVFGRHVGTSPARYRRAA